jgi:hypothetical protein
VKFRFPLSESIAIAVGLVTLLGLIFGGTPGVIANELFIPIMYVTAGVAVLVGVLNLLIVHLGRVVDAARGWLYSLVLIGAMVVVIAARIFELAQQDPDPALGSGRFTGPLFSVLQLAIESALAGLIAFFLVYAAYRMMRHRVSAASLLFVVVVVVMLLGWQPLPVVGDLFSGLRAWIMSVPTTGGTRGILIGVALGALTVGIRVLVGRDRSYKG